MTSTIVACCVIYLATFSACNSNKLRTLEGDYLIYTFCGLTGSLHRMLLLATRRLKFKPSDELLLSAGVGAVEARVELE